MDNDCVIILATYGSWGSGLCDGLKILCGKNLQIESIDTSQDDYPMAFRKLLEKSSSDKPVVVFSDCLNFHAEALWLEYFNKARIQLARNVSLPMVLRFISMEKDPDLVKRLECACTDSRKQCLYVNPLIEKVF